MTKIANSYVNKYCGNNSKKTNDHIMRDKQSVYKEMSRVSECELQQPRTKKNGLREKSFLTFNSVECMLHFYPDL
jgi:hypothetical protein